MFEINNLGVDYSTRKLYCFRTDAKKQQQQHIKMYCICMKS